MEQFEAEVIGFPWLWNKNDHCVIASNGNIIWDNSCGCYSSDEEDIWKKFFMNISHQHSNPEYHI